MSLAAACYLSAGPRLCLDQPIGDEQTLTLPLQCRSRLITVEGILRDPKEPRAPADFEEFGIRGSNSRLTARPVATARPAQ